MTSILIADDHSIVRSGLRQILATENDLQVCGEASHGAEVLTSLRRLPVDIVLMDLSMPGLSSLDLIRRVRADAPQVRIVVLSMHNEAQLVSRTLRAGANGYVTKDSDPAILLAALRKVAAGGRYIDPALVDAMVFGSAEEAPPHEVLSNREYEVLQCLCRGLSLNEISGKLHISAKTVGTHKARLMQKLAIDNNADLIRYGLQYGLS
jgi:DNA-binding NarL/FixJ family response regulator